MTATPGLPRRALAGVLGLAVAAPAVSAALPNPDAELIRVCAEHGENLRRYNLEGGTVPLDQDPLWAAYDRTRDAIYDAEPQTMAGVLAKARTALVEATDLDGQFVTASCDGHSWALDLLLDLERLYGGAA